MSGGAEGRVPALWRVDDVSAVRRPGGFIAIRRDDCPVPLLLERALVVGLGVHAGLGPEPALDEASVEAAVEQARVAFEEAQRARRYTGPRLRQTPEALAIRHATFLLRALISGSLVLFVLAFAIWWWRS